MKKITYLVLIALLLASCGGKAPVSSSPSEESTPRYSGYTLQFGEDFKAGMNFVDDFGISVAIVVDVSGSMGDRPSSGGDQKYIQASNALVTIATYLENLAKTQPDLKIQVSVLKFSGGVTEVLPLTILNPDGIAKLKSVCNPRYFTPDGGTAIGRAVEAGAKVLAQSGTIFNSLIVITDGENSGGPDPVEVIKALYSNHNTASTTDYPVSTSTQLLSFVGFDISQSKFGKYHDMGARVTSASNQAELETSLRALLEADITKLEGK